VYVYSCTRAVYSCTPHCTTCIAVYVYEGILSSYSCTVCKLLTLHSKRTLTTYLRIFIFIVHVLYVYVYKYHTFTSEVRKYFRTQVRKYFRTFESTNRTKVRVQLLYVVRVHVYYVHFRKYSYFRTRTCRPYVLYSTKVRKYESTLPSKIEYFRRYGNTSGSNALYTYAYSTCLCTVRVHRIRVLPEYLRTKVLSKVHVHVRFALGYYFGSTFESTCTCTVQ